MALHKKAKFIRPDKLSLCTICGVSTADLDWRTRFNDGVSEFASQVESSNSSGSTMIDNDSADRSSIEISGSTDFDSSPARINGVVSSSEMLGIRGSMNQETIVEIDDPVKDSDNEGDSS